MLVYDESTINFADDLATGTVSSAKCDFSNSASYGSYINNKQVAANMNVFVDFDFTLEHKVQGGGKIVIQLDGMETASGNGVVSWIYVSKGLTASGDYVSASWDSSDTIVISGYESTTSGPTISFTAQVKVTGGDCFKSVTSYASD